MAQLQMPQLPQFVNYVGNSPLPGGTQTSIFSANFTPGQFITSSGIPGFIGDTGTAGGFDMIGHSISQAGIGVGNSVGGLFSGKFVFQKKKKLFFFYQKTGKYNINKSFQDWFMDYQKSLVEYLEWDELITMLWYITTH